MIQYLRLRICPFERLLLHLPSGASVLDAGCGSGLFLGLLACVDEKASGIGLDFSEDAITVARKMAGRLTAAGKGSRLEFKVFDIAANWHTGRFDAVSMIDVLHHMDTGSQKEIFREAVFHVKAGGLLVYKDMCETPFCLAAANRLHDLLLARQWIHYRPIGQVEAWALDLGLTLVHAEEIRRYWYKHELRVFRR